MASRESLGGREAHDPLFHQYIQARVDKTASLTRDTDPFFLFLKFFTFSFKSGALGPQEIDSWGPGVCFCMINAREDA